MGWVGWRRGQTRLTVRIRRVRRRWPRARPAVIAAAQRTAKSVSFQARDSCRACSDGRERAKAKYGFYKHLAVYVVMNLMLFFINLLTAPDYFWCIWPLIGWGIAVAIHALLVYVGGARNVIVDRLTERELHRDARGYG